MTGSAAAKGTAGAARGSAPGVLGNYYDYCVRDNENNDLEQAIFTKWQLQDAAERLLPDERVHHCGKTMAHGAQGVMIYKRASTGSVQLRNTTVCGSVWHCPVCAAKISEHRRDELQAAIDQAVALGHGVSLVTLTVPHSRRDELPDLLRRQGEALRALKSGRHWQAIKKQFGILGEVRALEVTHGAAGWHPHTHALLFTETPLDEAGRESLKNMMFPLWQRAAMRSGIGAPTREHGLDISGANNAARYVGKWGFSSELTKAHLKRGRDGGRTPWDLLRDAAGGDRRAGALFKEYAAAFKGKRQLFWSRGLRALLCPTLPLFEDGELAACYPKDAAPVMFIESFVWYRLLYRNLRAHVIHLAANDPPRAVELLKSLAADSPLGWGHLIQ